MTDAGSASPTNLWSQAVDFPACGLQQLEVWWAAARHLQRASVGRIRRRKAALSMPGPSIVSGS
jgi:hypothetical protein